MKTGKRGDVGAHLDNKQRRLHTVVVLHGATLKLFSPTSVLLLLHSAMLGATDFARVELFFVLLMSLPD